VIRRAVLGLFFLVFAVVPWINAADPPDGDQDEPPRLKKKEKPAAPKEDPDKKPAAEDKKDKKTEPAPKERERIKIGDEPRDKPAEPEVDIQELLSRLLKKTRTTEERLANKEVGEGTRQLQRDILKDIESLIAESQRQQDSPDNQQQQDQQGGASEKQQGQKQQQGGMGQQRGQRRQMARGQRRGQRNQTARSQGEQDQQGEQQDQSAQNNGKQGGGGNGGQEEMNKLAEVYKDIWGHLPEALRAEMMSYTREQFMDKYKDQLKRYYSTIAEKGRKGE
jgi:hypothetical protein